MREQLYEEHSSYEKTNQAIPAKAGRLAIGGVNLIVGGVYEGGRAIFRSGYEAGSWLSRQLFYFLPSDSQPEENLDNDILFSDQPFENDRVVIQKGHLRLLK